jgi:hypothetical protein
MFAENFEAYADGVTDEVSGAGPVAGGEGGPGLELSEPGEG